MSLAEVFRLLRISRKTGVLRVSNDRRRGDVYFWDGQIYYAIAPGVGVSFGERLIKAGKLSMRDLERVAESRQAGAESRLLPGLLEETEVGPA